MWVNVEEALQVKAAILPKCAWKSVQGYSGQPNGVWPRRWNRTAWRVEMRWAVLHLSCRLIQKWESVFRDIALKIKAILLIRIGPTYEYSKRQTRSVWTYQYSALELVFCKIPTNIALLRDIWKIFMGCFMQFLLSIISHLLLAFCGVYASLDFKEYSGTFGFFSLASFFSL